ncbi:MAG: phosphopyruvate hydratase [Candidatus Levybacteria bacterium RIFCSPHIGHO2_01_FULL_40_10]|nr:MAG: phosphopyruvate hydratase [Candidatus Levybacteria bacterium RIFCSPHIGHO2_01_FULL_40_10]
MPKIKAIYAKSILNSEGNPTVEATVVASDGSASYSSVPAGVTRGAYEAVELYDGDMKKNQGLGVTLAVKNINEVIGPKLAGMEILEQQKIDTAMVELDGTQNKGKLGANAILSVSQAVVKAGAMSSLLPTPMYIRQFVSGNLGKKMPIPMFNILEGGKHGASSLNIEEFLIVPASSKTYRDSLEMGTAIYHSLKKTLIDRGQSSLVAAQGGFSPDIGTTQAACGVIKAAIETSGYSFSYDVFMGIDAAANTFVDGKVYKLKDRAMPYTQDDLVEFYRALLTEFSLIYIEDPFGENDWEGWQKIHQALGSKTIIAGDDITCTNPYRLQMALDRGVLGALVVKPSQIGTISEAIAAAEIARYKGLKLVVSGRASETIDSFIADFAVGIGADYVKFGAPARERASKYNKLLQIEEEMSVI